MPRLWTATIQEHRREVREAILDVAGALVAEGRGLRSVTMSQIAERAGIGRATLYKYFGGVEEVFRAWHERQITRHLEHLKRVRDERGSAGERLAAVLHEYATIAHDAQGHANNDLAAALHRDLTVADAEHELRTMIEELIAEGVRDGDLRDDLAPDELASYCLHALLAARGSTTKAAVRRLVTVTLAGLRPTG